MTTTIKYASLKSLQTCIALILGQILFAQEATYNHDELDLHNTTSLSTDSSHVAHSHLQTDTIEIIPEKKAQEGTAPFLDAEVKYSATDSLSFDFETKKMYLYGKASIQYGDINLTAHAIELDMDSTIAYAYGKKDSLGTESDLPVFKDKSGEYTMREMRYNFDTKKAIITHIVTEQGEGFIVGQRAKRVDEKTYYMKDAKYTTCQRHDHPHFYLNLTKAKVIPGKKTITGPAYLVIEDVPLPIALPFAMIPNTKSYSSGVIMPTYGDESSRGFYLRNGGYYVAVNDYFDLKLTADIYTKGSWGAHLATTYKKRYKFSGSFSFDYDVNVNSEKGLPDYSKKKDFRVRWNHSQDSKANPDQTFSASVNFSTSSYDKNSVTNRVNPQALATNQKSSSITYSRKWSWNPFRLSASLNHSQNSADTSISLTIPNLSITSSKRFYPFKPKKVIGTKNNPLHDLQISYSMTAENSILCKESELKSSFENFSTTWKNGMKHSIPVSTTIKLLKYFTLTPSFNYTERWYLNKRTQHWDEEAQKIIKDDPKPGFSRVYDYSFSVSTDTKIYTFYKPIRALFGDKVNAIRHVMSPSVSLSFSPDFSDEAFKYYKTIEYYNKKTDEIVKHKYSLYEGSKYGTPGSSKSGSMSLSLNNTIEMKVKSDKDSTGFRKIPLVEGLSFSTSCDFLKDSLQWNDIRMTGRTKIFGTTVSFNATFDPYGVVATKTGAPVKINKAAIKQNGKLAHLTNAGLSFGIQLSPTTFSRKQEKTTQQASDEETDEDWALSAADDDEIPPGAQMPHNTQNDDSRLTKGDDGYAAFDMPWSINLNYSLRVVRGKFDPKTCSYAHKITSSVNVSANLSLTSKWKLSLSTGYSFDEKKLSQTSLGVTRDLHCWSMNFNIVPTGLYKSYNFCIAISSSILKDLKYEQSNSPRDNGRYR